MTLPDDATRPGQDPVPVELVDDVPELASSGWMTVRCLVQFRPPEPDGPSRYEERLTLWHTDDFDEAVELAQRENEAYADAAGGEATDLYQAYLLFDWPAEGAELFSLQRTTSMTQQEYLQQFFVDGQD